MPADDAKGDDAWTAALTIEDIATYPLPGLSLPDSFEFSPDGRLVTYLFSEEGSLTRQLYGLDPESGERSLIADAGRAKDEGSMSIEEKLRRERMRQREMGITQYAWAEKTNRLLIPLGGDLYVQEGFEGEVLKLATANGRPILDPQFSPDGEKIAFVQDAELYVVSSTGGDPRMVTSGARGTGKTNGLAEYIAQEEMARHGGFWWSADSQWLAFEEADETHIPVYRIVHQGKGKTGDEAQEDHRYPFAGKPNAGVRLGVVAAHGGPVTWMDLGDDEDIYLARVCWLPNGRLAVQRLNREQSRLDLLAFDPQTGWSHSLLSEESEVWINLHDLFRPLKDGRFIWGSERTGFQHLYLYDATGNLERPLTYGEWMVHSIAGVDQHREFVYYVGSAAGPAERQLYAVSLNGGEPRQITAGEGIHAVKLDRANRRFVDVHQNLRRPPAAKLYSVEDGDLICTVFDEADPRIDTAALVPPEVVELTNRDGIALFGAIYRPPTEYGDGPYPTIISVYGGPHAQRVTNSWAMTVDMRAQYLRSRGFLVFVLDNRGAAGRGVAFEKPIKNNMGHVEVRDQVDGVEWLVERGLADPQRVGIYGWSYGGYMALMCLAQAADIFQAAVSGAPVTHWDGYDTCYTERYMGTPVSNPGGYERSSVMHHVDKIRGKVLLIHGLIDENVHFRHTARLINALIRARIPYDLLLFPDERHMPRGLADRVYMEERIVAFFQENL